MGQKTKKPVGLTGVGLSEKFLIIQASSEACASYLRKANASQRNEMELLHLKRRFMKHA